jgi:hypothetical protein
LFSSPGIVNVFAELTCVRCGAALANAESRREHEALSHEHACTQEECGLAFTSAPLLNTHLSTVHGIYRKQVIKLSSSLPFYNGVFFFLFVRDSPP